MLSNHIVNNPPIWFPCNCTFDMHDVSTMPYVLDASATPPHDTKKVIKFPKLLGYSDTYSQIKGSLIAWCQCDCISVTSEIIYELNLLWAGI